MNITYVASIQGQYISQSAFREKSIFSYIVGGGSFCQLLLMEMTHVCSISSEQNELGRWDWSHFKALDG